MDLRGLIGSISNKLKQVAGKTQENLNAWKDVMSSPQQRNNYVSTVVNPAIKNVVSIPQKSFEKVQSLANMATNPYGRSQIGESIRSKILPNIPFKESNYLQKQPTLSPEQIKKGQTEEDLWDFTHPQIKRQSASMGFFIQPPKTDIKGKSLKDVQIRQGGYTPNIQNYLQSVKTIVRPQATPEGWTAGASWSTPKFVSITQSGGYNPDVMGHELMHQVDLVAQKYNPDQFLNDYNLAVKNDPKFMAPIVDFINHYQKSQPEYFGEGEGKKNALATELYAQIGSQLGKHILNNPLLAKYYSGIFQETPQNYPGWVNPVPTPTNPNKKVIQTQQTKQKQNKNSVPSTPSSKKYTKIVIRRPKK